VSHPPPAADEIQAANKPGGPSVVPAGPERPRKSNHWRYAYSLRLFLTDSLAIWIALLLGAWTRFGVLESADVFRPIEPSWGHAVIVAVTAGGWLVALSATGSYAPRFWGTGPEEYKRVIRATLITFGALAVFCYALRIDLARGFVAVALPSGLVMLLAGRNLARRHLIKQRRAGRAVHRVVAVGDEAAVEHLRAQLLRAPNAGYSVVGGIGGDVDVRSAVRDADGDAVAVTPSRDVSTQRLREISWELEGTGVELVLVPSLTDVAGPRITVNPVGGLSLLHVNAPEFLGWRRIVKHSLDRALAVAGLLVLSPVLLVVALLVRFTSDGPALFRQRRSGEHEREFRVYKFRTMYADAEERRRGLDDANETDGRLFKIRQDPRVTPIGRFLRRTSIDELPQLINVVRGEMSLVGPRPLPIENGAFEGHERRRLLVRPGITGLWQVSGRSDLSWEDSVRLDLYYVENWSITLDLMILARTLAVVVRGSGAY
jgi:exopolysaccharide biosynthesis polyprenyl glycosylphosphotransferase